MLISTSSLTFILLSLTGFAAAQPAAVTRVPVKTIDTVEGKDLFQQFCAVCHGTNAKGAGPAASALKQPPTDLTTLAHRHGGVYPVKLVQQVIDGDGNVPAHGAKDMPVWGKILRSAPDDTSTVKLRVYNLAKYIEGLQGK